MSRIYFIFIFLMVFSEHALSCSPVAKLIYYSIDDKAKVTIDRIEGGRKLSSKSDQLCSGDRIKVPVGTHVSVKYYSNKIPETELHGEAEFPVYDLKSSTKVENVAGAILQIGQWFQQGSQGNMTALMTTRKVTYGGSQLIRTPLDRGEGDGYPFLLKSDIKDIHFFWRGGTAPWSAELVSNSGRVLVSVSASTPSAVLPLNGLRREDVKSLRVISSDGKKYIKPIKFEDKLQFSNGADTLEQVMEILYLDSDENWRLQLWSMVQSLDDSKIKSSLLNHLEKDDL